MLRNVRQSFSADQKLIDEARAYAVTARRSFSSIVQQALGEWLTNREREAARDRIRARRIKKG